MNHGAGYVYVLEGDRERTAAQIASAVAKLDGVAGAWTAEHYAGLGLPTADENRLVGDVVVDAVPGYCFGDTATGADLEGPPKYRGTHGQRPEHADNHAFFLASGPGIRRGMVLDAIVSRDVAPTLAQVLGISMPGVEGRRLMEIFA
jgi:hypothetical protein